METLIGEIIVLAIVVVVGFFAWKIFGKGGKNKLFKKSVQHKPSTSRVPFWDEGETITCSSWNISVLASETGAAVKTVPIDLSSEEYFTIGRDKSCSLCINDKTVSAYHAYCTKDNNGNYMLMDAESKNGIVCIENDRERKYEELPLKDGLICFLGNTPIEISRNNSRHRFSSPRACPVRKNLVEDDKDEYLDTKEYIKSTRDG